MPTAPRRKGAGFDIRWTRIFRGAAIEAAIEKEIDHLQDEAVEKGVERAKQEARVATGHMRDNTKGERSGREVTIYNEVEYAPANEFGTYKMSAKPFIRPGVEAAARYFNSRVAAVLGKVKIG